jgi:hypothetical protein
MDGFMAKVGNSKPVDANKGLEEKIVSNYWDSIEKLWFILS